MADTSMATMLADFERLGARLYIDNDHARARSEFSDLADVVEALRQWARELAVAAAARGVAVPPFSDVAANPWRFYSVELPRAIEELKAKLAAESSPTPGVGSTNDSRDAWMLSERQSGKTFGQIRAALRDHADWEHLENDSSVRAAIKRYCMRHGKTVLKFRREGSA